MHLDLEGANRYPILDVAVQTIGLLDEQHWLGRGELVEKATISPNAARPALLAVSMSSNSRTISIPCCVAYSVSSFRCAGIEKPSFSCSLDDTRTYRTASREVGTGAVCCLVGSFMANGTRERPATRWV